jgi:HEAT repeat protein
MKTSPKIPFDQFLKQLLDGDKPLAPDYFYSLSDLEPDEIRALSEIWKKIPLWRRQAIMEDAETLSAEDMLLTFVDLSILALQDSDAGIRRKAVQSLWEYDEEPLIPLFMAMVQKDPDTQVRAAAAGALGRYVFNGVLDELSPAVLNDIENLLLQVMHGDDDPIVRRSALEALGFSYREEIPALIEDAYASTDKAWIASALFAMGRSGNEKWKPQVLAMLEHPTPVVRTEAARAAGELDIKEATPILIELLEDPHENTHTACIWSLSQLGGEGVREILEGMLEEAEDDDDLDFLEAALDNLDFTESLDRMFLFELSEDEDGEDLQLYEEFFNEDEDLDD